MSKKEYMHTVNLMIKIDVIYLNLRKNQSKLFKDVGHIYLRLAMG